MHSRTLHINRFHSFRISLHFTSHNILCAFYLCRTNKQIDTLGITLSCPNHFIVFARITCTNTIKICTKHFCHNRKIFFYHFSLISLCPEDARIKIDFVKCKLIFHGSHHGVLFSKFFFFVQIFFFCWFFFLPLYCAMFCVCWRRRKARETDWLWQFAGTRASFTHTQTTPHRRRCSTHTCTDGNREAMWYPSVESNECDFGRILLTLVQINWYTNFEWKFFQSRIWKISKQAAALVHLLSGFSRQNHGELTKHCRVSAQPSFGMSVFVCVCVLSFICAQMSIAQYFFFLCGWIKVLQYSLFSFLS